MSRGSSFNKPIMVAVDQVSSFSSRPVVEILRGLGLNSGNLIFTNSLTTLISNVKIINSFDNLLAEASDRDCIVLAAANWLNEYEDLEWLAKLLEQTKLPVFLIGIGTQSSLAMQIPQLKAGTLKLLKLISERTGFIAARGEFTCEILNFYGIKNAIPTGCPSMLLAGPRGPVLSEAKAADPIVHSTRHEYEQADTFQLFLYRQARKHGYKILLQSETPDIHCVLGKADYDLRCHEVLRTTYGTESDAEIASYLSSNGLFFSNYSEWMAGVQGHGFSIGTRIHGTIASILAGIPSTQIVHDARTLEMVRAMYIPYILASEIDISRDLNIPAFVDSYDASEMLKYYSVYYRRFVDYFRLNGLATSLG